MRPVSANPRFAAISFLSSIGMHLVPGMVCATAASADCRWPRHLCAFRQSYGRSILVVLVCAAAAYGGASLSKSADLRLSSDIRAVGRALHPWPLPPQGTNRALVHLLYADRQLDTTWMQPQSCRPRVSLHRSSFIHFERLSAGRRVRVHLIS